jgi:predicted MFS family arabinose efflux permease
MWAGGPCILVWIYPTELFPTEFRATAVGIATSVSRFGAATGTYLLPLSISALGTGTTMLFGAILTAVAFVICSWRPKPKASRWRKSRAWTCRHQLSGRRPQRADCPSR